MRRTSLTLLLATIVLPAIAQTGTVYIPKAIVLPGTTVAETAANQVWSLRAALNVAALQCQFSPFLRTVPRYNALIKQHAKEFTSAQAALGGYFRRTAGKGAANALDRYNTRLYQSYTTLDAQLAFCDTASAVGRDLLMQPIGRLGAIASTEVTAVRASLTPVEATPIAITTIVLPDMDTQADN